MRLFRIDVVKVICKLGLWNVLYVLWYRFTLKTGIRKIKFPPEKFRTGVFFCTNTELLYDFPSEWKEPILVAADKIITGQLRYYGVHWKTIGNPPDWFLNPFNGKHYKNFHNHWTELPDFPKEFGDIKNLWEPSRFEWVVALSKAYAISGNANYISVLNAWLNDWIEKNPLNIGPNWKCGQEASIRIFNLLNSAYILNQWQTPSQVLTELIYLHLKRIYKNILYAIAQNNNHGISEAAALFIGSNWLEKYATKKEPDLKKFKVKGRYWLENRIKRLIAKNGSFSQYSVNYHRVLLDTLCFIEHWRKIMGLPMFSRIFYARSKSAISWLFFITDENSGNAPNLGANDGTMLLNLHSCEYRDFRPTIQLSHSLFFNFIIINEGPWDEPLYWYKINKKSIRFELVTRQSVLLDKSFLILRSKNSWAFLRIPYYRFRPTHNDAFHIDLFYKGKNIFIDAGTFSYNPPEKFPPKPLISVVFHNTAVFDEDEQMPSISRFLLGKWIKPYIISNIEFRNGNTIIWYGSYKDQHENLHIRKIIAENDSWLIEDQLKGNFKNARIIFNVIDDRYIVKNNTFLCSWGYVLVENFKSLYVEDSIHAPHYFELIPCKRLVIQVDKDNIVKTKISFTI